MKNTSYRKIGIVVIVIAIVLRFALASIHNISGDACWQLSNARFMAENKKIPLFEQFGRDEPFWAPPFFHIISAIVYSIFAGFGAGTSEFARSEERRGGKESRSR